MEELFLRRVLATDELHIVDHQQVDRAELVLEIHRRAEAQGPDKLVHEFFGRQIDHLAPRGLGADVPGDRVHQVSLAEADPAVQEQRIERYIVHRRHARLGNPARGGVGQLVRLADDEILEGEARIERRR